MIPQNQVQPKPQAREEGRQALSSRRAVLYSDNPGVGLLRCGRHARRHGDRVVSAGCEGEDRRSGRQALYTLVDRMLEGEFETIIAVVASSAPPKRGMRLVRLSCAGEGSKEPFDILPAEEIAHAAV